MPTKAEFLVLDELVRLVSDTGLNGDAAIDPNSALKSDLIVTAEGQYWRIPPISYFRDHGRGAERNIRCLAFEFVLIDDEIYHRTAKDFLL